MNYSPNIRFNWNVFPCTRLEKSQLLTPIGCLYTPFLNHNDDTIPYLNNTPPIKCSDCDNYINPFIKLDRANGMWWCPFCENRTFLPNDYMIPEAYASNDKWPVELQSGSTIVDYKLPEDISITSSNSPFVHTFLIDCYQHLDEIQHETSSFNQLKTAITTKISSLPDDSLLCLLTFDEHVQVHKPLVGDYSSLTTNDIFTIDKETNQVINPHKTNVFDSSSTTKIITKLNLHSHDLPQDWKSSLLITNGYLVSLSSSNRTSIIDYITNLKPKLTNEFKPPRATGYASYISTIMLNKASFKGLKGNVSLFTSGPCTSYPGNIVDISSGSNTPLRSHNDIVNFNDIHFLPALSFYKTLASIACGLSFDIGDKISNSATTRESDFPLPLNSPRWTFDIFTGSLDQVGVYEMKSLAQKTCGHLYLYDSFDNPQFKHQFQTSNNNKVYNSTLTVKTSPKFKVSRLIGQGHCLPSSYQAEKHYELHHEKISDHLSEFDASVKKKNFTNQWSFNTLESDDTLAIFFEPETVSSSSSLSSDGVKQVYIQFQLKYWDCNENCWKLRITTLTRNTTLTYLAANQVKLSNGDYRLINSKSKIIKEKELLASFDQDAFIVLLSRLLLDKIDTTLGYEHFDNIIKGMDRVIIRLLYYFGGISINNITSGNNPYSNLLCDIVEKYQINENFKRLPSLVYNLRRNPQLIKIFNSLPDETAFHHHWFMRFNCDLAINVIQPKLYKLEANETTPISLDCQSIIETNPESFIVLDTIFNIVIYKNVEKQLPLHHSNNVELVYQNHESIKEPLKLISTLSLRPISPKYIVTQKGHSQARFLLARLNPIGNEDIIQSNEEPTIWQKITKAFTPQSSKSLLATNEKSYRSLLTDDPSLDVYYEELMESVKGYIVGDE